MGIRVKLRLPALCSNDGRLWWFLIAFASWCLCSEPSFSSEYEQAVIDEVRQPPPYRWTTFQQVNSQPNLVPIEWVSTPEGRHAHSIQVPNPIPKDSGYRWWMTASQYFEHLCATEAGEFIYKRVTNVDGFLLMRPPSRPTDYDLLDRYKLEAPSLERVFQGTRSSIAARGAKFVSPPHRRFRYVEEPASATRPDQAGYLRASDFQPKPPLWLKSVSLNEKPVSRYAVTWRGIRREHDREKSIAGNEILVIDLTTNEVLAVLREFAMSGNAANTRDGVWWLNANKCSQFVGKYRNADSQYLYDFISTVLVPHSKLGTE